ncbi:AI-2E family transporter [Clostridium lundense]|uniref:AI-2E family transporter n=1 Tax=Clostridium lundense TaxID=319475 RepID=UPI001FA6ABE0|nr:AI-2E family transporter [Clostridium lundense]
MVIISYNKVIKSLIIINLSFLALILFSRVYFIQKLIKIIFKSFLLPLIISTFFYYIMRPLNDVFLRKGLKPSVSAILTLIISIFILSGVFSYFGRYLLYQINGLIKEFAAIMENKSYINGALNEIGKYININDIYRTLTRTVNNYIQDLARNIFKGINFVMDIFSKILLLLVTIFFFFKDGKNFKEGALKLCPEKYRDVLNKILIQSDEVLSHYVIGQSKVALSLSTMIFIGYKIIKMPNALLLASITFILAFIPFIGFFISMIIPWIIAFSMGLNMMIKLGVTFIVVQTLKGRVVVPAIMGHTMKIHPLTDIFLVIGAVALGGPIAAFAVIPIYSILKVVITNLYKYKMKEKITT